MFFSLYAIVVLILIVLKKKLFVKKHKQKALYIRKKNVEHICRCRTSLTLYGHSFLVKEKRLYLLHKPDSKNPMLDVQNIEIYS